MASTLSTEDDLKKMTVAQLRSMCKERRMTGYSKQPKPGLIARLLDWQKLNGSLFSSAALATDGPTKTSSSNVLEASRPVPQGPDPPPILSQPRSSANAGLSTEVVLLVRTPTACPAVEIPTLGNGLATPLPSLRQQNSLAVASHGQKNTEKDASRNKQIQGSATKVKSTAVLSKRPHVADDSKTEKVLKKPKTVQKAFVHPGVVSAPPPNLPPNSAASTNVHKSVSGTPHTEASSSGPSKNLAVGVPPKRNRFKALIIDTGKKSAVTPVRHVDEPSIGLRYLDFGLESLIPQMQRISLPPSVAQRKHVPRLSLLLSGISLQDLKTCTLVSRLFRYSGYLAAYNQLLRSFSGARLQKVLSIYPENVTNFWPYLRYRMNEVNQRKSIYEASFLGRTIQKTYGISDNLWTSPDDPRQITIAIRFLLTRLFFWVSLGHGGNMLQPEKGQYKLILNAQEVVPHEIWTVTVQSSSSVNTYYVLEATCEVIGEQETTGISPDSGKLRVDWSSYITAGRYLPSPPVSSKDTLGLLEHLQWSNHEEYSRGISKVWLSRIEREGDLGSAKLDVARRYILACVVSNSVSGPRLTSNQMQQEFNGIPNRTYADSMATKSDKINIFLPAHHHVESVHFTSNNGRNLHPALATVQTPGREYYILRDNGMQVGCEEEGVADIWMELLGCTNAGCV